MKGDRQREKVIVERRAAGATLQQLATEFGVSRERIRQILLRFEEATAAERSSRPHGPKPPPR